MSGFVPEQPKEAAKVPFFDDVSAADGWKGQTTTKSMETLKAEIMAAVGRLGGMVTGFRRGTFPGDFPREGFEINYVIEAADGRMVPGRLDVAALPVRPRKDSRMAPDATRREKALRHALFMLRDAFDGLWFLQRLSPGYAPLMPWMLVDKKGHTVSEMWAATSVFKQLLPPEDGDFVGEGDIVDGEIKEA